MKRIYILIACACLLSVAGCSELLQSLRTSTNSEIVITLEKVTPQDAGKISDTAFDDKTINIAWVLDWNMRGLGFKLLNKSGKTIKIDWSNVAYVDVNGASHRVMHDYVKYMKREESQPPTVIVSDSSVSDEIVPIDNVWFNSEKSLLNGDIGWKVDYLFGTSLSHSDVNGKTFKVLLPVIKDNVTTEYLFTFKITEKITTTTW